MKRSIKHIYYLIFAILVGTQLSNAQRACLPDDGGGAESWYWFDNDGDGLGGRTGNCFTNPPTGYTDISGDCNDNDPNIKGRITWYYDSDSDGFGSATGPTIVDCFQPINYVDNNEDCDDIDNPQVTNKKAYYLDNDKDGQAAIDAVVRYECYDPSTAMVKYVKGAHLRTDCDDTDENVQQIFWYKDTDGDGFGELTSFNPSSCEKPLGDYYKGNLDRCPGVFGTDNGCPPEGAYVTEAYNTVKVIGFNVKGKRVSQNKTYYDDFGKLIQTQNKDFKTGKTWASQTMYDNQGRPALQTLGAPTNNEIPTDFLYKKDFIKKNDGNSFTQADFENNPESPTTVGRQLNSLGWYYSTNNTDEPYQDITSRPYSRTIYSDLNPGAIRKTIGGNTMNGEWKNGYTFSMPAGQELTHAHAFGEAKYDGNRYKIIKTVSRDVHGVESVVFTDTDGNTLAVARSGNEEYNIVNHRESSVLIGDQGFVDIHIPVGRKGISVVGHSGVGAASYDLYNLISEQKITTNFADLSNGFYRISVKDMDRFIPNQTQVTYPENYYDYSLNYYDKSGRLLTSKQPLSDTNNNKLASTFDYNSLGQLETTTSTDEGQAWFLYREDGQIRFSTNSKQWENKEFSYTNYDQEGRPIESGVYQDKTLTYLTAYTVDGTNPFKSAIKNIGDDQNELLPIENRKEVHQTVYDLNDNIGLAIAFDTDTRKSNYTTQSFVAGNVVKTINENTTTWYSYDIYGRVQWVVQQIKGLNELKTIDYVYDPVTSQVAEVQYQKGHTTEEFIHLYYYDPVSYKLVKVYTRGVPLEGDVTALATEHANYEYYETGEIKRINLGKDRSGNFLQGIDYVYNLQGALKGINHPNLKGTNLDKDNNDLFGMTINYHKDDYARVGLPEISTSTDGIDQYNGNIKSIVWSTEGRSNQDKYSYAYNKNNWLRGASFNQEILPEDSNVPMDRIFNAPVTTTQNPKAKQRINLQPGFRMKATGNTTFRAGIENGKRVATDGDYNVYDITYDANGNIQTLNRNKQTENAGSNVMDQLSYTYKAGKPNQLLRVDDATGDVDGADDIGDQNGNNYEYNKIGQLVENNEDNISYIYNASGLVTEIQKGSQPLVKFFYNDKGHRVRKEAYTPGNGNLNYTEHYVRDAAGTAMAIYRDEQVIENTIYGASRLGVRKSDGSHLYQLTDHLGNVRAVVGRNAQGQAMAMTSATDYYPFGMPMPGRNQVGDYRYAYQGQEKDPETGKEAFELRLWDARIGRWLTTDPYKQYNSPYLGMGNNPITNIDPDGGKDIRFDSNGNIIRDSEGNIQYFNDNFFHNLIFGTRTQYADGDGWKTFELGDGNNGDHLKQIEDGVIDKIQFVSSEQVRELLKRAGIYGKEAQENPIDFFLQNGVGFQSLDFANNSTGTGIASIFNDVSTSLFILDKPLIAGGGQIGLDDSNFGNFLIGSASASLWIPPGVTQIGAHLNSLDLFENSKNGYEPQLDSFDDQFAIFVGSYYTLVNGLHKIYEKTPK